MTFLESSQELLNERDKLIKLKEKHLADKNEWVEDCKGYCDKCQSAIKQKLKSEEEFLDKINPIVDYCEELQFNVGRSIIDDFLKRLKPLSEDLKASIKLLKEAGL